MAGCIVLGLIFLTTYDVIGRYLFNSPLKGGFELSEMGMVWIVFLGIAAVQREKGHVSMDFILQLMPQALKFCLEIFGLSFTFVIMALVTWQSGINAWEAWVLWDVSPGIVPIPLGPARSAIAFGSALLCIRVAAQIVERIRSRTHEGRSGAHGT